MTEKQKKTVQIFQVPESNASSAGCEPSGCGPGDADTVSGCSCGTPAIGLEEMMTQFSQKHGDKAEIKLAEYASDEAVSDTLDALNQVLKKSNESLRVTRDNLDMVLTQSAPIIAVDGNIVSTRTVPSADQLAGIIEGESPEFSTASGGCC